MDSQELTFGLPSGSPSVYLDTSHSDVVDATASELSLYIPGGDFLLEASYERLGPDLLLVGGEYSVLVKGYFTHEQAPDLYTTDGSSFVPGSEATRLAGPAIRCLSQILRRISWVPTMSQLRDRRSPSALATLLRVP